MTLMIETLFKTLFLPPGIFILALALSFAVYLRRPLLARALIGGTLALLTMLSLPIITTGLHKIAEGGVAPFEAPGNAGAIVILSAGMIVDPPEMSVDATSDSLSIDRMRYGAHLQRQTGLPILVSGGPWGVRKIIVADVMANDLMTDFKAQVRWRETRSRSTAENAAFSAVLLKAEGIDHVVLVTHAWHMPRAISVFEAAGLKVTPAPTAYYPEAWGYAGAFLPSAKALHMSYYALYEIFGRAWYWVVKI